MAPHQPWCAAVTHLDLWWWDIGGWVEIGQVLMDSKNTPRLANVAWHRIFSSVTGTYADMQICRAGVTCVWILVTKPCLQPAAQARVHGTVVLCRTTIRAGPRS